MSSVASESSSPPAPAAAVVEPPRAMERPMDAREQASTSHEGDGDDDGADCDESSSSLPVHATSSAVGVLAESTSPLWLAAPGGPTADGPSLLPAAATRTTTHARMQGEDDVSDVEEPISDDDGATPEKVAEQEGSDSDLESAMHAHHTHSRSPSRASPARSRDHTPTRLPAPSVPSPAHLLRSSYSSPPRVIGSSPSAPSASGEVAAVAPSKRVKLKMAFGNLKEKWSNMKLFKKKGSVGNEPHSMQNGADADSHLSQTSQTAQATYSPSSTTTLRAYSSAGPVASDARLDDDRLRDRDRLAHDAALAKAAERSEKARMELTTRLARQESAAREKAEKEARKREEKLLKDRAKQAADQRKVEERREADLRKAQARAQSDAAKQMRQMLEKAAAKPATAVTMERFDAVGLGPAGPAELQFMHEGSAGTSTASPPHRSTKQIELLTLAERRASSTGGSIPPHLQEAAALSPQPPPPPQLGALHLRVVCGRRINGKDDRATGGERWKQKTCVEVIYGGVLYRTDWHAGANPTYGLSLHLPVFDISTDIVLRIVLKHSLKKNECIGMAVVPLSVIVNRRRLWQTTEEPITASDETGGTTVINEETDEAMSPASAKSTSLPPSSTSVITSASTSVASLVSGVVSPSSTALGQRAAALFSSLFEPHTFAFREWIQLYPSSHDTAGTLWLHRFPAAEDTILASGMERPKKELGRLRVQADLHLEQPLSFGYMQVDPRTYEIDSHSSSLLSPPLSASGAPAPGGAPPAAAPSALSLATPTHPVLLRPEEPIDFHKTVLKKNVKRIRRWLEVPYWLLVFSDVFTWRVPILTFYLLVLWVHVCFYMPPYQYPLLLVATCCVTNICIRRWHLEEYSYVKTFQDDAAPSNYLGEGHWRKFQRYKGVLAKISHGIGRIAAILEKAGNLLNFTDAPMSIFAYIILTTIAAIISAILYVVPAHVCVFLGGLALFVHGGALTLATYISTHYPDLKWFRSDSPSSGGAAGASSAISQALAAAQSSGRACVDAVQMLLRSLQYLYRRAPDHYELAHRILCERAISAPFAPSTSGSQPLPAPSAVLHPRKGNLAADPVLAHAYATAHLLASDVGRAPPPVGSAHLVRRYSEELGVASSATASPASARAVTPRQTPSSPPMHLAQHDPLAAGARAVTSVEHMTLTTLVRASSEGVPPPSASSSDGKETYDSDATPTHEPVPRRRSASMQHQMSPDAESVVWYS